ncbi:inactive polyglycylase TTLL10 isoform X1 [Bos indicus x Bos taurus]|uniref:inactive polyglycylase TTLL10 isoform X1 n=1 Tax=Bos indicus x Bos taurus TaxID=30522 RepID=UPI000F7D0932|nr:inactive polyglycylase TTLL10 isoform X1 [Bos indicus x Bos taurus]
MFPTQPVKKGAPGRHRSRGRAHSPTDPGRGPLKAVPPEPHRPDSSPPYSRPRGRVQRRQPRTNRPCREGLAPDRQDAEMALPPRGTRPHSHHRDRNQTGVQHSRQHPSPHRVGPTRCPVPRLGQQVARRARRGVGAISSQRYPCPGTPASVARSSTHFLHRRGPRPRTQVSTKRGKRSRMAGIRRGCARAPGWAHERPMGSHGEEGLLHQLSQLDQDAELDDSEAIRPQAALLEKHFLEREKQPPSTGQGPFFYIGGTNGASIISSYCKSKGWRRIQDSRREDYKLKWCEVKCRDTYCNFREGKQLLYQLPNNKLLTTKIGLLSALREHSRVLSKTSKPAPCAQTKVLKMEDFFPETYRLDIRDEREAFFTLFDETQMWICKPTASNQGKGIFLLRNQEEVTTLQAKTQSIEDDPIYRKMPFRAPQARVVQRYIKNPLLLDGKKFDVRSYLLIACAMPYMVFFGHGYARLTLGLYDPHSSDLSGHLTNQFMQKKSPLYVLLKEDTVWSMEHLNRYINDKFHKTRGLPRDWVFTTFTKRMQQIMAHCFLAVKAKLECKLGYFDLIGCDFLIDENFKVWLLEMNSNPALHTNCEVLKEVIPGVVMETLGEPPPRTLKLPPSACTCSLQVQTPTNPVLQHPEGCVATPASAHAPISLPAWCHPTPHHPVTSRRGGRSPFPRTALPGSASSSPPTPPQTWRWRPSRRAYAARRCYRCCPSAASCSCITGRRTCGRAWGAPATSPARRCPHFGPPATPRPSSHLCSAPPTGRARAGPRHTGASAARQCGLPPRSGAPGLPSPPPTAP